MNRYERHALLDQLRNRPTPWTDQQWREWAAVAAAVVLDQGYAGPRQADGSQRIDRGFMVAGRSHILTVGPGWNTTGHELGPRAYALLDEVTP